MRAKRAPILIVAMAAFVAGAPTAAAADRQASTLRTKLPIVVVDTSKNIGATKKVTAKMRVIDGRGFNRLRDRPNEYSGPIGIETRGTSSQASPKKQYAFETRKRSGKNDSVSLLGMPKENDWVLNAAHGDPSLIRSVLAYRLSNALGRYASRTRFVELVVNGRYRGVYVLAEKLKIDKRRVDVRGADGEAYLLEVSSDEKTTHRDEIFRLPVRGLPVKWTDPERDDLQDSAASAIEAQVGEFDRVLASPSFADPNAGYPTHLDVPAAVDYVLVNELFKNQDAFRHSLFMHRGAGTKLRFGPVWDFDVSSGNPRVPEDEAAPAGWITTASPWADRLWADPAFVRALADRWRALRAQGVPERLPVWAARYERELRAPAARDYRRWRQSGRLRSETDYVRGWLTARIAWMDRAVEDAAPR